MVISVLNASHTEAAAQMLLSPQLTSFADVDIIAGQNHYPAHRAVLAVHSLDFRDAFSTPPPLPPAHHAPPPLSSPPGPLVPTPVATLLHRDQKSQPQTHHQHPSVAPTCPPQPAHPAAAASHQPPKLPDRYRVHIALEDVDDTTLSRGWALVYAYIYGATVQLETEAVLAALPICRRYRFDELAAALDAFLCEGAVSPANCTRVFAAAGVRAVSTATPNPASKAAVAAQHTRRPPRPDAVAGPAPRHQRRRRRDADAQLVQTAAWAVMKSHFADVADWGRMPYGSLVRLLKLNDLHVPSEMTVFEAVVSWVEANRARVDSDVVAGLVKLVRFPTMAMSELERSAGSNLVRDFPVCRKYVSRGLAARADELRGLVRSVVMESSPVYRRRRTDALTFSDRVANWSRVEKSVHTSSRYFAGCLWNLVVEVGDGDVGLFLGCMSESEEREVDVELDFAVFVVRHAGGTSGGARAGGGDGGVLERGGAPDIEPDLVRKEVKGACFSRSGQRIGFVGMLRRADIEDDAARLLLRDTLFIGASIRLRSSKQHVVGISRDGDDTAESIMTMI